MNMVLKSRKHYIAQFETGQSLKNLALRIEQTSPTKTKMLESIRIYPVRKNLDIEILNGLKKNYPLANIGNNKCVH